MRDAVDTVLPAPILVPLVVVLVLVLSWVGVRLARLAWRLRDRAPADRVSLSAIRDHEARPQREREWPPEGKQFYIPRRGR